MPQCEGCGEQMEPRHRHGGLPKRFCSERCRGRIYQRQRRAAGLYDRKKLSEGSRLARLKRELGLSAEDYAAMVGAQGGVCALCQKPETRGHGKLAVDHDHSTGIVRGLLCASCNTALGRLGDSVERIECVLAYLRGPDAR